MIELSEQLHNQFDNLKPKAQAFIQTEIFMESSKSPTLNRQLRNIRSSLILEMPRQDLAGAILVKDRMDQERDRK